jgi:glycosyltransferase involved in cell wall biosynthesis
VSKLGERPLLTFAVFGYNQEGFIQEAIEAALAQTYSPLEIVLTDDCSADRTYEIMREAAEGYRGPHRLVLNRNSVRRSICGQINRLIEIAHGELIFCAAGDDISLPHRAETVYQAWEQTGRQATSIHSAFVEIDEHGRTLTPRCKPPCPRESGRVVDQSISPCAFIRTLDTVVYGCAHAFSPRLFGIFGNIPEDVKIEDPVIAFRSVLAGRLLYVNEPLLKYRLHGDNQSGRSNASVDLSGVQRHEDNIRHDFKCFERVHETFLADLETARERSLIGVAQFEKAKDEAGLMRNRYGRIGEFLQSGFIRKCVILLRLRRIGLTKAETQTLTRRLLPRWLFVRLRLIRNRVALATPRERAADVTDKINEELEKPIVQTRRGVT